MNIYVAQDLLMVKNELKKRGYNIVEDEKEICDAIICNLKDANISNLNKYYSTKREGTLIIDYGSKSIEELDYILNNRSYSALF